MDLLAPLKTFDRVQQRHRALAFPLAVVKKFGDDEGGNLVGLIAYRAFFSIFPLLLVFTTILGFVLSGHPKAEQSVLHSAVSQFPIIGDQLKAHSLGGSTWGLAIGLVTSIWAGLGITLAAQTAMARVWAVPMRDRPDFLQARLRGLGLLVVLGVLNIVSTAVSGLVAAGGLSGAGLVVGGYVLALAFNLALFFMAFRLLTDDGVATRDLLLGVVLAAVAWELLQILGGYYAGHVVRSAGSTYGTFALVIGLLAWIHLGATAVILAAEANAVRVRGLWPRSLFGAARLEDEETLTALAKIEERQAHQHVTVSFDETDAEGR